MGISLYETYHFSFDFGLATADVTSVCTESCVV